MHENAAWEAFEACMRSARAALDGMVPVALIVLPAVDDPSNPDGVTAGMRDAQILWPASFPPATRGKLLALLAEVYQSGLVQTIRGETAE